jgi:hypothetical protein
MFAYVLSYYHPPFGVTVRTTLAGAVITHCKEVLEYDRVVLAGWSGGGSLTAFYQSQARCSPPPYALLIIHIFNWFVT